MPNMSELDSGLGRPWEQVSVGSQQSTRARPNPWSILFLRVLGAFSSPCSLVFGQLPFLYALEIKFGGFLSLWTGHVPMLKVFIASTLSTFYEKHTGLTCTLVPSWLGFIPSSVCSGRSLHHIRICCPLYTGGLLIQSLPGGIRPVFLDIVPGTSYTQINLSCS